MDAIARSSGPATTDGGYGLAQLAFVDDDELA
jgi:hypothetical protein